MIDISSQVQAALVTQGYCKLPPGQSLMGGVVVPAGALLDGAGAHITAANASFCVQLNGPAAQVKNLLVDDSGIAGVGILCHGWGVNVRDCVLRGFDTGIKSDVNGIAPPLNGGESFVDRVQILDSASVGLDWLSPSDCQFSNIMVSKATHGDAAFGIRMNGGSGVLRDCHVWGAHDVAVEFAAVNGYMVGCRIEGARGTLLRLTSWRQIIRETFLYYPVESAPGVPGTIAIEAGSLITGKDACHNDVEVVIASTNGAAGYAYKSYLQHNHGAGSNKYKFTFQDVMQPQLQITGGPADEITIESPKA